MSLLSPAVIFPAVIPACLAVVIFLPGRVVLSGVDRFPRGTGEAWEGTWPLVLLVICILGCVFVGVSLFLRQQRRLAACRRELEVSRLDVALAKIQVTPHFLLNGLNNIAAAIQVDKEVALDYAHKLSEMLRFHHVAAAKEAITAGEELAYIDNYLALQKYRLGDRITVRFNKAEAATDVAIPPLLLCPLIESAVECSQGPGERPEVGIDLAIASDRIRMQVAHTLPGHAVETEKQELFGILRGRLQLLFPGKHLLRAERAGGREVTLLEIDLPYARSQRS